MSKSEPIYERMIRYLKDLLSNRERHLLEKEVMRDVFDDESFEGLTRLSAGDLESDMGNLMTRIDDRVENRKKRNLVFYYRIAASVIVLMGVGTILYFVLRTPQQTLITQETKPVNKTTGVTNAPAGTKEAPENEAVKSEESQGHVQVISRATSEKPLEKKAEISEQLTVTAEDKQPILEKANDAVAVPAESPTRSEAYNAPVPEASREKKSDKAAIRSASGINPAETLSAKIIDKEGQPLSGVHVTLKGSNQYTTTDANGKFRLQTRDTSPVLTLNSIGYLPVDISASEVNGQAVTMNEDTSALNEVVVTSHNGAIDSVLHGRAAGLRIVRTAKPEGPENNDFIYPVPPFGSFMAFRGWMNKQVDPYLLSSFKGKFRLQAKFTLKTDGTVTDVVVKDNVPEAIVQEYKRAIEESTGWIPAMENKNPVETEVVIRFVVTLPLKQ
jgi:hypothetical protein